MKRACSGQLRGLVLALIACQLLALAGPISIQGALAQVETAAETPTSLQDDAVATEIPADPPTTAPVEPTTVPPTETPIPPADTPTSPPPAPTSTTVPPTQAPTSTSTPSPIPLPTSTSTPPPLSTPTLALKTNISDFSAAAVTSMSITLTPASPVALGTSVQARATFTWSGAAPNGTVAYSHYPNGTCTGTGTAAGTATVTAGTAGASSSVTFSTAGTFSWRAVYDDALGTQTTACATLVVNKTSPTVSLSISPTSITAGSTSTGTATISTAATANAGGTVVYAIFTDSGCTAAAAAPSPVTRTVTNRSVATSGALTFNQGGTWYWKATYSGDTNNNGASSSCVALTVSKKTTTLSLSMSPTSVTTATPTYGTATLSGGVSSPGGTVIYTVYTNNSCTTALSPAVTSTKTVTNGTVPPSDGLVIPSVGTRYVRAVYSGDAGNAASSSSCVSVTVSKASPTLSLSVSPNPVPTGSTAVASATLSGASSTASGTVTYGLYTNSGCTTQTSPAQTSTGAVTNGAVASSTPFTFSTPGTFYVRASYGGDSNNNAASNVCVPIIAKAFPSLALNVTPGSINAGATATGSATLTGATASAAGTVTYTVYTDGACSVQVNPAKTSVVNVTNAAVPASTAFTFTQAGTFYWRAAYSGDASNSGASSACVPLNVKSSPALNLGVSPNPVQAGGSSTGSATLVNATSTASGTVIYRVYTNAACSVEVAPSQGSTKTVTNGAVPASNPVTLNQAGTYYWNAVYSGDAINNAATSSCVAVTVSKATPSVTIAQSPNPVSIGSDFSLQPFVSGAVVQPAGTVNLDLFSDSGCTRNLQGQNYTLTMSGGNVAPSPAISYVFPGTAYARATYSGDTNNNSASSGCQAIAIAAGPLTASITSTTLPTVSYSNASQVSSGELVLFVSDSRGTAAGWSVTIASGDFVFTGASPTGDDIPAANFILTGSGTPSTESGQPIGGGGPVAGSSSGSLDQPQTVLIAMPGYGSGSYSQPLDVTLQIPRQSQVGTYTAEITVTTSAAP